MSKAARTLLLLVAAALLATCAAPRPRPHGSGEVTEPPCDHFQSPRRLEHYDHRSDRSIIKNGTDESWIYYYGLPRTGGEPHRLHLCGQHYHCHIENVQECNGAAEPPRGELCAPPEPGDWVEVHTVYAARVDTRPDCDRETLDCYLEAPFVVRAYHAQVTAGNDPFPAPWHPPFAEWTGSNTGPDEPGQCKPIEAQWSFSLGCGLRVGKAQLSARFHHADGARLLQGGVRVSKDLTLVEP